MKGEGAGPDRGVTVIIPTLAREERAAHLERAIASVHGQEGVGVRVVVVVNGPYRSPRVEALLRKDERVRLISLDEGGLPRALQAGRAHVTTPYFSALDDDDMLPAGALLRRIRELEDHPDTDVVVTNGLVRSPGGGEVLHVPEGHEIQRDPLAALLQWNWLLPGSWLARSHRVVPDLFERMPRYLECTYLAARFAAEQRLRWVPEPTLIYHEGSPMAESCSLAYSTEQPAALRRLLELDLPDFARKAFRLRIASACHSASMTELHFGSLRQAWRWHLASLGHPGGWRYLPYTRHLMRRPRRTAS